MLRFLSCSLTLGLVFQVAVAQEQPVAPVRPAPSPANAYSSQIREIDSLDKPLPTLPPPATTPLPEIEQALRPLCAYILQGRNFPKQLQAHQTLQNYLTAVLAREESYGYPFDSLVTISQVAPADKSFRIFTWQVQDPSGNHSYGGVVQRKFVPQADAKRPTAPAQVVSIPLNDAIDRAPNVERTELTADRWLGALYYKPRLSEHGVLSYEGSFERYNSMTGKAKREKTTYYILLGYNGHDAGSNYKIIDAIQLDPKDPRGVTFGAPVFYLGAAPRSRVVFKYADGSAFNLNQALVVQGKKKKPMLVFDHLAPADPKTQRPQWDMGADGTQDGLEWIDRQFEMRKGFFGIRLNVAVYEPALEDKKYDPKVQRRRREEEEKRLREQGFRLPRVADERVR